MQFLGAQSNDLEPPAVALQPVIAGVLAALRELAGCKLARMSGSGATCFALFRQRRRGGDAAKLRDKYPWWCGKAIRVGG